MAIRLVRHDTDTPRVSGPAANERLTAWVGAVVFTLLALEGVTLLELGQLLIPHIAIGLTLVGPVVLKIASTGYRFIRYYSGHPEYKASGPPRILLRVLAPFLIVATILVLGTGTALLVVPPAMRDTAVFLHKASFAAWFVVATIHVSVYVWRVPRLVAADLGRRVGRAARRGASARMAAVVAAILLGVILAAGLIQRAQPWTEILQRHHDR